MYIYSENQNIYDAIDMLIKHGIVAVSGTKTIAMRTCQKIIMHLKNYDDMTVIISYHNVPNQGYLYYLYDTNRLSFKKANQLIEEIDAMNPIF